MREGSFHCRCIHTVAGTIIKRSALLCAALVRRVRAMSEMMTTQQCGPLRDHLWETWQYQVLEIIRSEYSGVLQDVNWDDVDWNAWRPLFDVGYSPCDAVLSAFGKVA